MRVPESGAHRAADAEVERQVEDRHAVLAGDGARPVRGAVVDHEHADVGQVLADLGEDAGQRLLLVPRREHDQHTLDDGLDMRPG